MTEISDVEDLPMMIREEFYAIGGIIKINNIESVYFIDRRRCCEYRKWCDLDFNSHVSFMIEESGFRSRYRSEKIDPTMTLEKFFQGLTIIYGIPLEEQIKACAAVAGLTSEEMRKRMVLDTLTIDINHDTIGPAILEKLLEGKKREKAKITSVSNDGSLTINEKWIVSKDIPKAQLFGILSRASCKPICVIVEDLYNLNPKVDPEFLCLEDDIDMIYSAYYTKYSHIEYSKTSKGNTIYGPCFICGSMLSGDGEAWAMSLPPVLDAEVLAKIIKKHFIGIGKIIEIEKEQQSVYFIRKSKHRGTPTVDLSRYISFEIDPRDRKSVV